MNPGVHGIDTFLADGQSLMVGIRYRSPATNTGAEST
jgi:hypothetical protein